MEVEELPQLVRGNHYRVKIYDEQPHSDVAPHRQIRPSSLGRSYEGQYLGTVVRDHVVMIDIELDVEPREFLGQENTKSIGSFHVWLVESIEEI